MATALAKGEITASALTARYLDRIERHDPKLHAFVTVYADEAREAAEAADRVVRAGHRLGPLHGLPVAVKDVVDMAGRVTMGGSKVWDRRVSKVTATLVSRLIGAGMIVIGKTHTVEFAMTAWGTNRNLGTPWNPWDMETHRAPGGSSSGSGVAVAAGLAPWAICTDTGGSVRVPSAWCGLVGLKTTLGRISTFGVLPVAKSLDTVGPLCRTVKDAALLYGVLRGPDLRDPLTLQQPLDDPRSTLHLGVGGLRLARLPEAERELVDAEVLAAYDAALEVFASLGARIVDVSLPRRIADMVTLAGVIFDAEAYAILCDLFDDPNLPIDEDVRRRLGLGQGISARDYLGALREREEIKRDFAHALIDVDALLTPTTTMPPPPVAAIDQAQLPSTFTLPVSLLDYCALSLPNSQTSNGLPTSLQIVCRGYEEALALRIGQAFQQATDWHRSLPSGLD